MSGRSGTFLGIRVVFEFLFLDSIFLPFLFHFSAAKLVLESSETAHGFYIGKNRRVWIYCGKSVVATVF